MLSPLAIKLIKILPESLVVKFTQRMVKGYIKKYAGLQIQGMEKLENLEGPFLFICNHLSNSDGLVLDYILKDKYDPFFIAGAKLSDDPITNLGTKIVKNIQVKPNTADKDAITCMVKTVKGGESLMMFPEGTRSRTGGMIEGKKGVLLIARLTKAKIIPIGMSGTDKLLPINESGDMGSEKWNSTDVIIKFGDPVVLSKREKEEEKHAYDDRCLNIIMGSIAELLPESYRGVYK